MKALMLGLVLAFALPAAAQERGNQTGRFQIVNGTPQLSKNIMLIDTWTGETWQICTNKEGEDLWCKMSRSTSPAGPPLSKR